MLEKLLAYRQIVALRRLPLIIAGLFGGGFSFKKLVAGFMAIGQIFGCVLLDAGVDPCGEPLDLTGYELVMFDDFEGDTLNTDVWYYRANGARRCGYNAPSQVQLRDGNLVLTGEYLENGAYGEGWYAGMIGLKQKYTRGYFEIRCICNKDKGFWSAFWLQAQHPYEPLLSRGGVGGAEIDIFEAMNYGKRHLENAVTQTIHCAGKDGSTSEELNSQIQGFFNGDDIYNKYNTYGLEWTEDEYIFYINGVESARSTWANGVSQVPEELIVSLEIPGELSFDKATYKTEFTVDYVKVYQKQ